MQDQIGYVVSGGGGLGNVSAFCGAGWADDCVDIVISAAEGHGQAGSVGRFTGGFCLFMLEDWMVVCTHCDSCIVVINTTYTVLVCVIVLSAFFIILANKRKNLNIEDECRKCKINSTLGRVII